MIIGYWMVVYIFGLFRSFSVADQVKYILTCYAVNCIGGVMASIVAFQAVDPGSTPGRRM